MKPIWLEIHFSQKREKNVRKKIKANYFLNLNSMPYFDVLNFWNFSRQIKTVKNRWSLRILMFLNFCHFSRQIKAVKNRRIFTNFDGSFDFAISQNGEISMNLLTVNVGFIVSFTVHDMKCPLRIIKLIWIKLWQIFLCLGSSKV